MDFASGRPRDWDPEFDRPHLAVPILIVLLAGLIAWLPVRPVKTTRILPPAPVRTLPTTILAPTAGVMLPSGHTGFVEGLAQPGSIIRLYWYDRPLGEPTQVGPDGRWRFSVSHFPPGQHSIRASAWLAGRYEWSKEVVFVVAAAATAPAPKTTRPGSTPKTSPKSSNRR